MAKSTIQIDTENVTVAIDGLERLDAMERLLANSMSTVDHVSAKTSELEEDIQSIKMESDELIARVDILIRGQRNDDIRIHGTGDLQADEDLLDAH